MSEQPPGLLEEYLDSVTVLPDKMQANFHTLRDLDDKRNRAHEELEAQVQALMQTGLAAVLGSKRSRRLTVADANAEAKLEPYIKACAAAADEKLHLAMQTYDLVDKHIQRLDKSLRKYEEDVEHHAAKEGLKLADLSAIIASQAARARTKGAPSASHKKGGGQQYMMGGPGEVGGLPGLPKLEMDLPIDPNEPTYCFCNRVSFGEMIACDNEQCKIEWFHFECVGLPREGHGKGKWYCPDCAAAKRRGKR